MPQNRGNTAPRYGIQILVAVMTSTTAFRFPGAGSILFMTVGCYLADHDNLQMQFITQFHQLTTSTILTLHAFLQLKYQWIQDQNNSPFSTHPTAMRLALATSALHYLAFAAALRFPLHRLAHHLLFSSAYAAVAAMSSVILPDSAAPFVYAVFGLLSTAELLLWMRRKLIGEEHDAHFWIRIRSFFNFNNIYGDLGNFSGQITRRLPI